MNEDIAKKLLELIETGSKAAAGQLPSITTEFLNYLIFEASLGIVKGLAYTLIPLLIFRLLGVLKSHYTSEKEKHIEKLAVIDLIRGLSLVSCLIIVLSVGFSDAKRIGKIIIAPKIFMLEEGAKLLKQGKK